MDLCINSHCKGYTWEYTNDLGFPSWWTSLTLGVDVSDDDAEYNCPCSNAKVGRPNRNAGSLLRLFWRSRDGRRRNFEAAKRMNLEGIVSTRVARDCFPTPLSAWVGTDASHVLENENALRFMPIKY
jgi:hypothetical protein